MRTFKIILILVISSCSIIAQDFYRKQSSQDPLDNMLSLRPTIEHGKGNMAQMMVSELIGYGEAFKYSQYLEKGLFDVELTIEGFNLRIYESINRKKPLDIIQFKEMKSTFRDNADNEVTRIGNYVMQKSEQYLDNKKIETVLHRQLEESGTMLTINPIPQFNLAWEHRVLWDAEILSNLGSGISGRIMNRTKMRQYLSTPGGPGELLSDLIDGVIVPHDAYGVHAKLFMLDRVWNRIVYCDKDFNAPQGQAKFKSYGEYGSGNNQYKNPTGITYGTKVGNRYPLYICDYVNNRIVSVDYDISTFVIEPSTFRTVYNITKPLDISFHEGLNKTWEQDDYLWYTTEETPRKLRCRNAMNNYSMHEITSYVYKNITYPLKPGRLDVYSGWWNNMPVRAILAVIDENTNSIVYFRLDENGLLPSNNPTAFWVQQFPSSHKVNSIKLATTATPWNDPVASIVSTNDATGEGYLHVSKVVFRPKTPYVEVPAAVIYLASQWVGFTGYSNSNDTMAYPSYKRLIELEVQDGFMDVFSMENWDDQYGVRRLKAGADILSYSMGDYCKDWNSLLFSIRTTNSVYIKFQVRGIRSNNQTYNAKILKVNGSPEYIFNNGSYYMGMIPSYNSYFNVALNQSDLPNDLVSMWMDVKVVPGGDPEYLESPSLGYNIQFYPSGGIRTQCGSIGGCPFVLVNNEQGLQIDNNILHRSEFTDNINSDITDKYILNTHPSFSVEDTTCILQLQEFNNDHSYFDRIKLFAVDHPQGTKLGITENKDLIVYAPDFVQSPDYAFLNDSDDVSDALQYDSTGNVEGDSLDNLNSGLKKEGLNVMQREFVRATLFVFSAIKNMKSKRLSDLRSAGGFGDSIAVLFDPSNDDGIPPINPPAKDYAGELIAYNSSRTYNSGNIPFAKRVNTGQIIVPVAKEQDIDSVSITWNSSYDLSYVGIVPIYYDGYVEHELELTAADNSKAGDVLAMLDSNDNVYAEMDNQSTISLKFKNTTEQLPEYWIRDYVLMVDGQYVYMGGDSRPLAITEHNNVPKVFKLHQNYPNPFNPTARIKFDIPKQVKVLLKVYDILGREVRTLVNEVKNAGFYEIPFDGSSLASGVYFYRIEAGDFVQSKKMVLVK